MHSFKKYPSRRECSLFLQLQVHFWVDFAESIFTICCSIILDMFFHAAITYFEGFLIKYSIQLVVFWKVLFDYL